MHIKRLLEFFHIFPEFRVPFIGTFLLFPHILQLIYGISQDICNFVVDELPVTRAVVLLNAFQAGRYAALVDMEKEHPV